MTKIDFTFWSFSFEMITSVRSHLSDECLCEPGWGRKSCLLDITVGPVISYITGEGICDTSTDECREFIIETDGVVELFFAKMTVYEVRCLKSLLEKIFLNEPRYEKTGFLHMRKQRRRSASR